MKITKKVFFITTFVFLLTTGLQAQHQHIEISQIVKEFRDGVLTADQAYTQMTNMYDNGEIHKCAAPLHVFEYKYKDRISPHLIRRQKSQSSGSGLATYISPGGKFEFTYETTGEDGVPPTDSNSNGVPDYVEEAGLAADFAYGVLVTNLGYSDPIPTGTTYEIFFLDMGFYGFAETYSNPGGPGTRIALENDFDGFPGNDDPDGDQLGALRVTMAHEFKHAIQFVQNGFSGDSDLWAEMDGVLAEEVVYDEVNDYYNYLGGSGDIFGDPGTTVIPGSYEDVTWALYFHEKFGSDFWPNAWERIENDPSGLSFLAAVSEELNARGLSVRKSISELYLWHYASGSESTLGFGFDEAMNYPGPSIKSFINETDTSFSATQSLNRLAADFYKIDLSEQEPGQVSISILATTSTLEVSLIFSLENGSSVQEYYSVASNQDFLIRSSVKWSDVREAGLVITNVSGGQSVNYQYSVFSSIPDEIVLEQNFPNPFNPDTQIPIEIPEDQKITLEIFDYTGRKVTTLYNGEILKGTYNIPFDAANLASGVYVYRLTSENGVFHKRMTLVK